MHPEKLDLERTSPGEACQPSYDRALVIANEEGQWAIVIVAGGGNIVGDDAFLDEANVGFVGGIFDSQVQCLCFIPGLILLRHHASPLTTGDALENCHPS